MTPLVVWTGGRNVTHPALAVPCGTCGAFIGRPCRTAYASGDVRDPHQQRADIAEEFGFRWAPGAAPATSPQQETLAFELASPENRP